MREWWRDAAIYQLYVRSFGDANGDGLGDLGGIRERLSYLASLGVDAIWFSPWYVSPLADGGYDVADYRAIEPVYGSLSEAEQLIADAGALGIRTIVDIVPNHVSSEHEWFQKALAEGPGSPYRDLFWFRPGRGHNGDEPPNDWPSEFRGGGVWTRTKNPDGSSGDWYMHLFATEQPDLNWDHPLVRAEHESILRFWFDRGAAGVRIDSAVLLVKDPELSEVGDDVGAGAHPYVDRDDLHDIYKGWRAIANSYDPPRVLIGELWLEDNDRFTSYLASDELHTAFNFDFLTCAWDAMMLRASIERTMAAHAAADAPATWLLSNHDVTRPVTRYGREDSAFSFETKRHGVPTDLDLGTRRARAAALLAMALPGVFYFYQGEELGLPEVDIPLDRVQDPMHFRSGGRDPGRDGCRVPLPWRGSEPPYGFSPAGSAGEPWLPQPEGWATYTVESEEHDETSTLHLYRTALAVRRELLVGRDAGFEWIESDPLVLHFRRGTTFECIVNFSDRPIAVPRGRQVVIASRPVVTDASGPHVPPDGAAWSVSPPETSAAPDLEHRRDAGSEHTEKG